VNPKARAAATETTSNNMMTHQLQALTAVVLLLGTGSARGAMDIGGTKQLFIDDRIIASLGGAQRVFKPAQKTGPVLSASTSWERKASLAYPTVRREGPHSWKMWYRASTPSDERTICYATSTNGVHWIKPRLGIYPQNGGDNNIVLIGSGTHVDTPSVFKEADGYYLYCSEGDVRYVVYHSPDGIHDWKQAGRGLHADHARIVKSGTVAPASHNYDICLGVYDRYRHDYIFHFKVAYKEKLFGPNDWQRLFHQHRYSGSLARVQDTPFPLVQPRRELADDGDKALEPGTLRAENYGTGMYPQEDGGVIGFSWLFSIDGHNGPVNTGGDGTKDGFWHYGPVNVLLVYTRDIHGPWQRPTRTPILPRGPAGSWDSGMVSTANAPVEVPKEETFGASTDQVWMYFTGANHLHNRNPPTGERDHQFGIAQWRMDGFAALEDTDGAEDRIITRPIRFRGRQLVLNADVEPGGYIQVRIRPADGGADLRGPSDSVQGDHQDHIVRWKGNADISDCAGKEVVLEARIRKAKWYSLRFTTE
jgi:hypothetical protein